MLTAASDGRELYALVLVPSFALLATAGLMRISPLWERRLALGTAALLVLLSAALLGACLAALNTPELTARLPDSMAMPAMVKPGAASFVVYALVASALLGIIAVLPRYPRGMLPLAGVAGISLAWASLALPWGGYLNELKGYQSFALSLRRHCPREFLQ